MSKKIIIIAGPNGAGKTTFARSFLPQAAQCPRFINADSAVARVVERVRQGGHHVPEDVIRRRTAEPGTVLQTRRGCLGQVR
jgi:predicted ABC-type ATPase